MNRQFYLDLAATGHRVPVGADLVLHAEEDAAAIRMDGSALGRIVADAAEKYNTPLAIPLMDLTVEKELLASLIDIPESEASTFHFSTAPDSATIESVRSKLKTATSAKIEANIGSVSHIAKNTSLVPIGMSIGPFSLMTKLLADPITPVYMSGMGTSGDEDPDVKTMEAVLNLGLDIILASVDAQIAAGAKAIFVCEPAANTVYLSPKQLNKGSDVFDRLVMEPNRKLKAKLEGAGVDLIFHDCGELLPMMIEKFVTLDPAILSLGSSRELWVDAELVPESTVIYGNLPSKKFFSDEMSIDDTKALTCTIVRNMKQTGKPFILGSECDVLSVPGSEDKINSKVQAMLTCEC